MTRISPWHSLRTRATVFTLAVFVLGIWMLTLYATRLLRADMERMLGTQQFQAVSVMADDIDRALDERMQALQAVARQVTPAMLNDPPALQAWLDQRVALPFFNGGAWVAGADGVTLADVPRSAGRVGISYKDREHVAAVLRDGKPVISRPVLGKKRNLPLISMVVPVLDAQGRVIGVLTGVTDLDKPNFLDKIAQSRYGQAGGYLLMAPQHGVFVTATDKNRIMQPLPVPGSNAMYDRYMQGFEGYGVAVSSRGVEELSAAKGIPTAGWLLAVAVPTAEAFAPVTAMQQNILVAAVLLTLLTGLLTGWILKRQLSPLLHTARALRELATANRAEALPVARPDEMGQLIASFNQVLGYHRQREDTLRTSEALNQSVLNSLNASIAVVDAAGVIVAVNTRWQEFALENSLQPGTPAPRTGVGVNYFSVCKPIAGSRPDDGVQAGIGLRAVLDGRLPSFQMDYPCGSSMQPRWFVMTIMPLGLGGAGGAVITHTDITERRQAQERLVQANLRMAALIEGFPDPIFLKDADGRWLLTNEPAKQLYQLHGISWEGKTGHELCAMQPVFTVPHQACMQTDVQTWLNGVPSAFAESGVGPDGVLHHFEVRKVPIFGEGGERESILVIARDVTDVKQTEESLRIAATAFESQQGMVITDAQRRILRVNQAFTQITGYSAEEAIGQGPHILASGRHDAEFYDRMAQALEAEGIWIGEIWNRRKNGEVYPEWLSISAVRNPQGSTTHYVGIFSDISEQVRAKAQIDHLSFYDPLTHLPNRRLLLDRLDQALHTSTRHARKNALLFVDLDNFKMINDTLGHQQGDRLLVQVAQRLRSCTRDGDTVARLGSDEFVVMLENLAEDEMEAATQAESVGNHIIESFGVDFELERARHHATPSIGITLFGGEHIEGGEEPLKRAELAMFKAKAAGRNTLRFFEAQMQAEVSARAALEADLRTALAQQQLLLHYQPQVVGAGRITGVEVLVRWQHPQRGMVPPVQFIPLAEECGLILPLGQWVLETACAQLTAWAHDPALAHLTVAVNVSADQFKQTDFVATVQATLERTGANPRRLKLELTESMLVDDVEAIIAKMDALKARGVAFSLDDFGTGYSSLAYLKRLPLHQLKIDQGFVRNIVTDPNDAAISRMVVGLAESMGLAVIAEGVELQAQADMLAHLGCHAYQGYLFGRPVPLAELEALVRGQ